jgi:trypsin
MRILGDRPALRSGALRTIGAAACVISVNLLAAAGAAQASVPRIIGGGPVAAGTWPWVARVVINDPDGNVYTCSGTVVAPNVILTAGHCAVDTSTTPLITFNPSWYQVMTGSVSDLTGGQVSGVSQVLPYPDFETFTNGYGTTPDRDLALLQLSTPTSAPVIPLATSSDSFLYVAGTGSQIAGWGLTQGLSNALPDTLDAANTVVQSTTYCQAQANLAFHAIYDSAAEMCAIDAPYDTEGICEGDSGGPLIAADSNGNAVEIGLTSWGATTCNTATPGFFTNLMTFSAWISSQIQLMQPPVAQTVTAGTSTETSVIMRGSVNPNGTTTSYYFRYGSTEENLGQTTPTYSAGNGTIATPVSMHLTNLSPGEPVYYKLVAANPNGTSTGQVQDTAALLPPLPEYGTYRGSGPQVHPLHFYVKPDGTQLTHLVFGFTVACTRHRGRLSFKFAPSGTFRLNTHQGLGLAAVFYDSTRWKYTFKGRFSTKGHASGTISVVGHDATDGLCRSGQEHWSAH